MSVWEGISAGVAGFQRGSDWAHQSIMRGAQAREASDERRVNEMESALRREQSQPAAPAAPVTPEVSQPAQGSDPIQQATQELRQLYFPQQTSATGGAPQPNMQAIRDMVTGQGQLPVNALERAARNASGNQEGPLGRRDFVAYMDEMERRLNAAGLGHRAQAWRGRALQQFQSAAARTMAMAATAAQGGDMETAARLATRAYGFVPDGGTATVQRDAEGNFVAVRVDEQGRPMGQPTPLNAQTLREMAIGVADPGAMETLLLQREDRALNRDRLAETIRHNRASEGIMASRAARAGAGGAAGRETSLTVEQRRTAYADIEAVMEDYEEAAAARPGGMGSTGPARLGVEQVRGLAHTLVEAGVPGAEAARIARSVGLRQANPVLDGEQIVGVEIGGRTMQLPPATLRLIEQYRGATPAPQRAAPTHAGQRAIRQQP